ncbi:MAG: hypothetical protein Q9217_000271 [Psora testacea]
MIEHKYHKHRREQVVVTEVVTAIESATYQLEDIIVYVDDKNLPVSTTIVYKDGANFIEHSQILPPSSTAAAPRQAPTPPPAPASTPVAEQSLKALAPYHRPKPALVLKPPSKPSPKIIPPAKPSPPPTHGGGGGKGVASGGPGFTSGVTYTPYNADNSCKTESQVAQDLADVNSYQVIRLYGTDCNQVANVIQGTKGRVSIFAGIFDINDILNEVNAIATAVDNNWKLINTVSVGNELVNNGAASVAQIISAIGTARSALKAKGYNGPVVTVDTMMAMKANPQLCRASDFCAINCHAFFDGNVSAGDAGLFVAEWARKVSQAAGGKTTVVTESGWPTRGNQNNKAIPSPEKHQQAMQSLNASFSENLVLYGLYNDLWKKDSGATHGAEKYWGIRGNAPSH